MNGWAGFLSRISQDSRIEFFMAAFTLKLVAKTKVQNNKNKTNMIMIPVSFDLSTKAKVMALPVHHSLVSSYLFALINTVSVTGQGYSPKTQDSYLVLVKGRLV